MNRPHDDASAKAWRRWERECEAMCAAAAASDDWLAFHQWHTLKIEAWCIAGRKEAGLPLAKLAGRGER